MALGDYIKIIYVNGAAPGISAERLNRNEDKTAELDTAVAAHISDSIYQTAGGTATAITLSINETLVNGFSITFIASANTNGATTTINTKPLYKPNTTSAPALIVGKAYTVWYNSVSDCFFIKASAEGDVVAANVLAGKTFSSDNDTGLMGTMPNNGAVSKSLAINGSYTIPEGYHNGSGKVSQSITTKAAATYIPSTSTQTISAGQYLSGAQTISPVTGTATADKVDSGYTFSSASGINLTGTSTKKRWAYADVWLGSHNVAPPFIVTGLGFKPSTILVLCETTINSDAYQITSEYSTGIYQSIATLARYKSVTYGDSYTSYQAIIPTWSVGAGTFSFSAGSYGFTSVKYWAFE